MTNAPRKRDSRRSRRRFKRRSPAVVQLHAETLFGIRLITHALVTIILMLSFTAAHRISDPAMRWVVYVGDLCILSMWVICGVIQISRRVAREWRERE